MDGAPDRDRKEILSILRGLGSPIDTYLGVSVAMEAYNEIAAEEGHSWDLVLMALRIPDPMDISETSPNEVRKRKGLEERLRRAEKRILEDMGPRLAC